MPIIQLQATTSERISLITEYVRRIVSDECLGVDDVHLLGNKALILRSEIFPKKMKSLCERLMEFNVIVDQSTVPEIKSLDTEREHPITLQITSYSEDTNGRVQLPRVPG
jgi:hypothetical protein